MWCCPARMADSMVLATWSAQLASKRPLSFSSSRPSLVCWVISISVHRFSPPEQIRRNHHAARFGGGRVENVFQSFEQLKGNTPRRFATQDAGRDFGRGDAAIIKIP